MATLTFSGSRIAPLDAISQVIVLDDGVRQRRSQLTAQVVAGQYSGGVIRVVGTDGYAEQITYTVASMSRRNFVILRGHQGKPMLYRDEYGNLDVGVLRNVNCDLGGDSVSGTFGPVSFTLLTTTHDETSFTL